MCLVPLIDEFSRHIPDDVRETGSPWSAGVQNIINKSDAQTDCTSMRAPFTARRAYCLRLEGIRQYAMAPRRQAKGYAREIFFLFQAGGATAEHGLCARRPPPAS